MTKSEIRVMQINLTVLGFKEGKLYSDVDNYNLDRWFKHTATSGTCHNSSEPILST